MNLFIQNCDLYYGESKPMVKLKPTEYAKYLRKLLDSDPKLTLETVAFSLGRTVGYLERQLSLLNLDRSFRLALDGGALNKMNAYTLAKLGRIDQLRFGIQALEMNPTNFYWLVKEYLRKKNENVF